MKRRGCLPVFILMVACGTGDAKSALATSRDARYVLRSPENLPDGFWDGIDSVQLGRDFLLQRRVGWDFWGEMLRILPQASRKKLMVWQTWYSREDLQRIFRHLYENLDVSGRRQRLPFTLFAIEQALLWNDQKQFEEADWDAERFERWFAAFDTDEKQRAIPGMQKILFNREVMHFLLQNYSNLEICQKQRQTHKECAALSWPDQAVFLKTSWRRSENGFLIESFATDTESLRQQWEKPQWTAHGTYEPDPQQSFAIRLPSGQKFHLTGLHASLRVKQQWFWTSLWLGAVSGQELAVDQSDALQEPWKNYRLCSVDAWQTPLRQQTIDAAWPQALADFAHLLVEKGLWNWCSNPYLEPGPSNHKTNCTGCHQHAGLNWTQQEFLQRLTYDLSSLIYPASPQGPADYVWSLFAGPDPLVQPLMDNIEFFDVYDPYQ